MAALRHVRIGSTSKWINLLGGQSSIGNFNEAAPKEGKLNTIQKRWLHPTSTNNTHAMGTANNLLRTGLISGPYGVGPTWSVLSAQRQRYNSTDATQATSVPSGYILEPPSLPDAIDVSQTVNALGEPSLASMGLGSYYPPGWYQHALEFLHVSGGMPWWEAIIVSTVVVKVLSIPLTILSQRTVVNSMNHRPKMDKLQEKMAEAKLNKDGLQYAKSNIEMKRFLKETNTNPLKPILFPLAQMPIFISVFIGLRKLAYYPVESMAEGGLWWFSDLTVSDPYFILPLITSSTLLLSIELGSEGMSSKAVSTAGRYFMRAVPVLMVPIMMTFPAALNVYWLTSNLCGLIISSLLRQKSIRKMCKIPVRINHPKTTENKSFKQSLSDAWAESKRKRLVKEKANQTMAQFKKAGTGPLTKTYATDPTLQTRKQPATKTGVKKSELGPLTKTYATDPSLKKTVTKSSY